MDETTQPYNIRHNLILSMLKSKLTIGLSPWLKRTRVSPSIFFFLFFIFLLLLYSVFVYQEEKIYQERYTEENIQSITREDITTVCVREGAQNPSDNFYGSRIPDAAVATISQTITDLTADEVPEAPLISTLEILGSPTTLTDADISIIEQVVYHEVRGDTYEAKMAVAQVILNRVNNNEFPDTVYSVVSQPKQFSSYYTYSNAPISDEIHDAVQEVINGKQVVPDDVVYFWLPKCTTYSYWFQNMHSRNFYMQIGEHNFYYSDLPDAYSI